MLSTPDISDARDRLPMFQRLLQQYELPLRRLAGAYFLNPADQDDLYQEIVTAIWTALPRFRGGCSERTWVYRIAHNTAISASLRSRRRQATEAELPRDIVSRTALGPEAQSMEAERRRFLVEAIRSIEGMDKHVLVLHLEGLSNREVAEVAGLSEGAVATRLSRLRVQLTRFVKERIDADERRR